MNNENKEKFMCNCKRVIDFKPMGSFIVGESGEWFNEYQNYQFMSNAFKDSQKEIEDKITSYLNEQLKPEVVTIHDHDKFRIEVIEKGDEVKVNVIKKPELKDGSFYKVKAAGFKKEIVVQYDASIRKFKHFGGWVIAVNEVICEMVEA